MSAWRGWWRTARGPRLLAAGGAVYSPAGCEAWGDRGLRSLGLAATLCTYCGPLLAAYAYLYRPGAQPAASLAAAALLLAGVSLCARTWGRSRSPQYRAFLRALAEPHRRPGLAAFDFDFDARPLDFDSARVRRARSPDFSSPATNRTGLSESVKGIVAELAVRTFGLALIYPGSTALLRLFVERTLLESRIKLVEDHAGRRCKIKTTDGNFIDCMFFDRSDTPEGKTLVIASEGNAGFYEIGIVSTPIEAGRSVLGWNRPGFGCSTGRPFPEQERRAIDAVVQFAVVELGFALEDVVLYGWSIGCYSAAWAAAQYPDVRSVILDATFDDLLPLAVSRMPPALEPLVVEIVKNRVNLNIAELLKGYSGPVKLVRRTSDEIICVEPGDLSTNRGNDLLIELLAHRHPESSTVETRELVRRYLADEIDPTARSPAADFPGDRRENERILALVREYLSDYRSSHCTPLPVRYLQIPPSRRG